MNASNVKDVRFVFGFRMRNASTPETIIKNAEIYRGSGASRSKGGRHRGQTGRLFASIAPSLIIALSEFGTLGRSVMTRHSM